MPTSPTSTERALVLWAEEYNDPKYFKEDPIAFPTRFAELVREGKRSMKDVEVAAVFAAHFAWGRRAMIVRDCSRLFDQMDWKPYDYVMRGRWRDGSDSIHRTVKWSDVAATCGRLRALFQASDSLEGLDNERMRVEVFGQRPDPKAPDKKINMLRRWMVRRDGKVDLGLWLDTDPGSLLLPLDVHVHRAATELGLTSRKQKDLATVEEITSYFRSLFPGDPCKGDFALFGHGVTHPRTKGE